MKRTNRGFAIYGQVKDTRGCVVRIQASSASTPDAVWIFCDDVNGVYTRPLGSEIPSPDPAPHLTRAQAKRVIRALQRFVDGER